MSVSDHQCSRNMLQVSINDSLTVFGGNQVNACLSVARCPSFKQTFPLLMFRHPLAPRSPGGHNNDGNDNENTVDAIQPYSPFIKASRELTAELHSTSVDTVLGNYAQLPHGCRYRLLFLARQCPPLRPQAYAVLAANVAQHSADVTLAQEIKNDLGGGATTVLDDAWLERTRHQQQATTDKLNRELRTYKANLVRESIRMAYTDLGDHAYECGDLPSSFQHFSNVRDYCSTSKHRVDMFLRLIRVCVEMHKFQPVVGYCAKVEHELSGQTSDDADAARLQVDCAKALAHMDAGRFSKAAELILALPFHEFAQYSSMVAPSDLAVYGVLCALASPPSAMDRHQLRAAYYNQEFKQFLELDANARELLGNFVSLRFGKCVDLLVRWHYDWHADVYLHRHVDALMKHIRQRLITQFAAPFSRLSISQVADIFRRTPEEMQAELVQMIMAGDLEARVDVVNRVLSMNATDDRVALLERVLSLGHKLESTLHSSMLRANVIRHNLSLHEKSGDAKE